ncbi:hypothetical protein H257_08809 [Aphanomyces astaci]|uniref:Uncharacterized protein n=1 Tax=Aphanomyces astaci TaxID=112090 RepID=W4GEH6_APHAT|nr:hypothetical protein H257_08809 [Aphanomyces astaci]ETV77378.1 hypothetical protein H257_08809 [Aphanomyces astaci]|eukprot:XP_009833165.1 hypothetical protein H257_08809 [Aphanomyces astaci]
MASKGLVVFDYDRSLIDDNSDTYIFHQVQPELVVHLKELTAAGVQWTQAVDQALSKLNCSKETLIDVIGRIPVQDGMLDAVHLAHERGWEVAIVSDANTVFIDAFLNLHNLTSIITQVFTNHSAFQGDTLHVTPYHPLDQPPHGCPRCPTNMCKGSIVKQIKASAEYTKILYIGTRHNTYVIRGQWHTMIATIGLISVSVGDGGGDFCPVATELSSNDVVFAREKYELLHKVQQTPVLATVVPWNTGFDILKGFQAHIA